MKLKAHKLGTNSFSDYEVVETATLQCTSMQGGNNKFYHAEVQKDSKDRYRVYTRYGRTGTPGREEERMASSEWEAKTVFESLVEAKKKGKKAKDGSIVAYRPVQMAAVKVGSTKAQDMVLSDDIKKDKIQDELDKKDKKAVKIDSNIATVVQRLYKEAGQACQSQLSGKLKTSADNPLGTLTLTQIEEGRKILHDTSAYLNNHSGALDSIKDYRVNQLTDEFYSMIPQEIQLRPPTRAGTAARERWLKKYMLNNAAILSEKEDLLDLLADVQGMVSGFATSDVGKKYEQMKCKFSWCSSRTADFKAAKKFIETTHSTHHRWKIRMKNVWKMDVAAQKAHKAVLKKVGNVEPLFHGSRASNILGICKRGLLMRPPGVIITGSMFGNGIYFASQSTKSSQYSSARFGGGSSKHGNSYFMFIADVALGKIKKYKDSQWNLTKPPRGYNSVQGVKGPYLLHDEFIVYSVKQQILTHLVEFTH